jgi:hypothetical protein
VKKFILLIVLCSISFQLLADFINLIQADKCETILEVFINDNNILVKLEIGEQDYQWFSDVIPKEFFEGGFAIGELESRLDQFMKQKFVLRAGSSPLSGKVLLVEQRNRIPRASLYTGQADSTLMNKKIIYVEIEYPISRHIKQLSFTPPLLEGSQSTLANIGFIAYHKTIPVNDLRYLGTKENLHLDWADPWYSYFENRNIRRHHSSSFMSFLYVEPYEVRHEILGRIKDLEDWMDFDYGMDDMIQIDEQDSIKKRIGDFLVNRNIVEIDGEERKPIIDRIHFVEVRLSGIQIMEIPKPLPYSSAIIGVIFAYPDDGMPKEVKVRWDMFSEKIQNVPTMSVDPAGPWPYDLQPSDSILTWTNFLKHYKLPTVTEQKVETASVNVPIFSIVFVMMILYVLFRNNWTLAGLSKWRKFFFVLYILLGILAFPIGVKTDVSFMEKTSYTTPEAKELISQLLKNTYRAFDFREEGDVYDKLSMCNDEGLLQKIYFQTRKSMVIENQGGIEAKIDEVLVTKVEAASGEEHGLAYRCNWIVKGVVGHWGHKHRRVNQYDAIISLKPIDGTWKMHDLDIIEEVRL